MTLLSRDEVPVDYQDKLILSAYRPPGLTALESIWSVFEWHNETFNFWTHFLVFGYFMWKFYALNLPFITDAYYWPLLCLAIGTCTYPLLSSLAHIFCSMDLKIRHLVFYLDYMGISIYSCSSSIAFLTYSSPPHVLNSIIAYFFAYTSAILAIMSFLACCISRHHHRSIGNLLRLSAFSIPYLFTAVFLLFWLFYNKSSPLHHHYAHILWNPVIGLVNASRLPERYIPLSFDVIGHSHQIFHVVVFIATNYQVNALVQDCLLKKSTINTDLVSRLSIQMLVLVLIVDTLMVVYNTVQLYKQDNITKKKN